MQTTQSHKASMLAHVIYNSNYVMVNLINIDHFDHRTTLLSPLATPFYAIDSIFLRDVRKVPNYRSVPILKIGTIFLRIFSSSKRPCFLR